MIIASIDAGAKGAIAFLDAKSLKDIKIIAVYDMPMQTIGKFSFADPVAMNDLLDEHRPEEIVVENFSGAEGKNTKRTLSAQGANLYMIFHACILHGLPDDSLYTYMARTWKPILGVQGGTDVSKKKKTFNFVCKTFPDDSGLFKGPRGGVLDGRSDAVGIGLAHIKKTMGGCL